MSGAAAWVVATAAGLILAAVAYVGAHASAPAAIAAALLRWLAATILVALLLNAPVAVTSGTITTVALDVSRSWRRLPDESWNRARELAARADSLLIFGDSARIAAAPPLEPRDAYSRAGSMVDRAVAAGRAVHVVTDGRLDDPDALARLPRGSRVEVVAAEEGPDLALVSLDAPRSSVRGDTLDLRATLSAGAQGSPARRLTLQLGTASVESPVEPLEPYSERQIPLRLPVRGADGPQLLLATLGGVDTESGTDAVPANDTLAAVVEISPAAGAVVVSTSPDYDVRGLIAVLRGAAQLPTRAYLRVAPGEWRLEGNLTVVSESAVRASMREAPLVVIHGDTAAFGPLASVARGALLLMPATGPSAEREWYPMGAPPSPLAGALAGLPWDSLPPLATGDDPAGGDWRGLTLHRNRGAELASPVAGREGPPRRAVVAASGFWRWEFRGGAGVDAYRAFWGSLLDWLAAERVDPRGVLPDDPPVRAGEPVRWRRTGSTDSVVTVALARLGSLHSDVGAQADSVRQPLEIRFESGESTALTPPLAEGLWRVSADSGQALLVVNPARELLPRRPNVESGEVGASPVVSSEPGARSFSWLYLLAVLALCAEWLLRRRAGLR